MNNHKQQFRCIKDGIEVDPKQAEAEYSGEPGTVAIIPDSSYIITVFRNSSDEILKRVASLDGTVWYGKDGDDWVELTREKGEQYEKQIPKQSNSKDNNG